MREIKFRAWDSIAKDWHTFEITDSLFESQEAISFGMHSGQVESLVWQQYAGLEDKNGTPVYEGDLVLMNPLHKRPHLIQWTDGGFAAWSPRINHHLYEKCLRIE